MFAKAPIFHVGYPYAGSELIQKQILARLPRIDYLGRYEIDDSNNIVADISEQFKHIPYQENPKIVKLYRSIVAIDSLSYDSGNARGLLKEIARKCEYPQAIFSWENVTSVKLNAPDITVKAQRIRELFPEIKILIMIREPKEIIQSVYTDSPVDPTISGSQEEISMESWLELASNAAEFSLLDSLHFDKVVELYCSLFRKANLMVLPFEMLMQDPGEFSKRLGGFCSIEKEELLNLINRCNEELQKECPQPKKKGFGLLKIFSGAGKEKSLIPSSYRNKLDQEYAASHARISSDWDLDLGGYGYAVG